MTRLASVLSLALVFTVAACDDDDKPAAKLDGGAGTGGGGSGGGGTGGGGTGGGGTGGAAPDGGPTDGGTVMCTGTFGQLTQAQLQMLTGAQNKKCAAPADVALICTRNVSMVAGACGVQCVGMGEACINTCIRAQITLTADCASCYVGTVTCAQQMCLQECIANPAAEACTTCQVQKGCRAAFFTCSGLPGGAPADGGAGDGGATDALMSMDAPAGDTAPAADTAPAPDAPAADAAAPDAAAPDASVDTAATPDAGADAAATD